MKLIKNMMTILVVFCISIMCFCGSVSATTANLRTSASKVTVGNNVSITVTFSEKTPIAQFTLNYDSSKFTYVSVSSGTYMAETGRYVYVNDNDIADLGSVTFNFKGKATGTGSFSISKVVLEKDATISNSKVSVTVENAKNTTNNKPSSNTNKPSTNKPATNNNQDPENNETPEIVIKSELEDVLLKLEDKVSTDYTEESWKELQDAIEKARNATTNSEYDEVKGKLTIDNLIVADFEKDELFNILIELIGKAQKDYTEESWEELQKAISTAQSAKLKSEYDEIKDKLTTDLLEKKGGVKEFFENFIQGLEKGEPLYLAFAGSVLVLLLIVVILLILLCRKGKRRSEPNARRLK